ncbi:MAG: YbaK/EbsC family protein [Mariprofundaceae bacterium]|nr:YbaK/EbsC family protein [Mariprofundaceae bacterium]
MPIANTLKRYLDSSKIQYDVVSHPFSRTSMETAEAAKVSGHQLAKGVILKDGQGYLMAVLPSPLHVQIITLNELTGRNLELVEEDEVGRLFSDCDLGAIPPVGDAYQLEVVLDSTLLDEESIYFEAGDHRELIRVNEDDFQKLLKNARFESFAD